MATEEQISFSHIREKHYEQLGIEKPKQAVGYEHVLKKLDNTWLHIRNVKKYFDRDGLLHAQMVERIFDYILQQKEASARMLIDQQLLMVAGFLKYCKRSGQKMNAFMLPELRLASKEKVPDVTISWRKYKTTLSGSVDYGIFIYPKSKVSVAISDIDGHSLATVAETVAIDLEAGGETSTVRDEIEKGRIHLCLIEAKARGSEVSELEKHIPQVIAESIAAMEIIDRMEYIRWCLTTGTAWIFGMTRKMARGGKCKYKYFTIDPITIDHSENIGIDTIKQDCLKVLNVLIYWAQQGMAEIAKDMFSQDI